MNRAKLALSVVALSAILGCGSGGGGGVGSTIVADFTPEPPAKATDAVSMTEATHSGDTVTVSINVSDTQALSGAAFDVAFDTNNVEFVSFSPGTLLEQGGHDPIYTVDTTPGGVVVGASRTGGSTTNVSGTKSLIKLKFQVKDVGTFDLTIQNQELYGAGAPPVSKTGIDWTSGSLVGN